MFVRSNMDVAVTYNKSTGSVVLKPNTVTFVKDTLVTAKELKDCYGDRISILSQELVEEIIKEEAPKSDVVEEQIVDNEIERLGNKADEANTGDEEIDNFLNGKTDVVPEGTEEITEEEALKLKAQADAEAKAKEEAEKLEALKAKELAEKAKAKEEAKKVAAKSAKAPAKNKGTKKNK